MAKQAENIPVKVSAAFQERLASLGADGTVRAVVMLAEPAGSKKRTRRLSPLQRRGRIAARIKAAKLCVPDIDVVIQAHGGRRLDEDVNSLGTIAVETTASGFKALAALKNVHGILEDQPVHLVR